MLIDTQRRSWNEWRLRNGRHTHTHTHKTECEHEDVTVLWNQWVNTDREVTANRPDIRIN